VLVIFRRRWSLLYQTPERLSREQGWLVFEEQLVHMTEKWVGLTCSCDKLVQWWQSFEQAWHETKQWAGVLWWQRTGLQRTEQLTGLICVGKELFCSRLNSGQVDLRWWAACLKESELWGGLSCVAEKPVWRRLNVEQDWPVFESSWFEGDWAVSRSDLSCGAASLKKAELGAGLTCVGDQLVWRRLSCEQVWPMFVRLVWKSLSELWAGRTCVSEQLIWSRLSCE
jgi:hypothetical protein